MKLTAEEVYSMRLSDGTYAAIMSQLEDLGTAALANVTYGVDFTKATNSGQSSSSYVECVDGSEFSTLLFGEVCHSVMGTRLSAIGNHYAGPTNTPIKDHTSIKDVLVLSCPTFAPDRLSIFYNNQVATLGEVRQADEEEEIVSGNIPSVVKECIRSDPNNPNAPMNLIAVTLQKKYGIPKATHISDAAEGSKPARITKKRLTPESDAETLHSEPDKDSATAADRASHIERGHKIELGAFYPLDLLPDHQGPYFQQKKAKLVQLDIRDIDGDLIAPWNLYDKLRPGTLVLVQASLVVWIMRDNEHGPTKKYYQLVAHSMKVLAESGEDVEDRPVPAMVQKASHFRGPATPAAGKSTSRAFAVFESPKKNRTM